MPYIGYDYDCACAGEDSQNPLFQSISFADLVFFSFSFDGNKIRINSGFYFAKFGFELIYSETWVVQTSTS